MQPHPEHSYIEALLNNNEQEIEKIYSQFSKIVSTYVRNNSGTEAEAKDLFQDTLVDLYHMGEKGFILTCPFKPYFLAMCRYKWLDQLKANKKRINKELDAFGVTIRDNKGLSYIEEEIKHEVGQEKMYQIYRTNFLKLSPTCQEIIGLSLVENEQTKKTNTLKNIAELLDLNYSYVRRHKNDCLEKLIALIKNDSRY